MERHQAIGIFDSGIGGLTVLKEIRAQLPGEDIIYLGDTARVPFGTKSPETVLKYSIQDALFLMEQGIKALVVACNTASAYALPHLQKFLRVPVLGVIVPGARNAVAITKNKSVGVIGTEGTIKSLAYAQAITSLDPSTKTLVKSCPLLVSLAEEGWLSGEITEKVLENYLAEFKSNGIDTLILGCTHYPLFKPLIGRILGDSVQIVDSAVETARMLNEILHEHRLEQTSLRQGSTRFFSTDAPDRMQRIGHLFLGHSMPSVTKVDIL